MAIEITREKVSMIAEVAQVLTESLKDNVATICMSCPLPPPSSQCFTKVGKKTIKTNVYSTYRNAFATEVLDRSPHLIRLPDGIYDPKAWYIVCVTFYFERITKKNKGGGPSEFLRLDADNRFKAMFDSIAEFIGIDDANFKLIIGRKDEDEKDPRADVEIRRLL